MRITIKIWKLIYLSWSYFTEPDILYISAHHFGECALICQGIYHEWSGEADYVRELHSAGNEFYKVTPCNDRVYVNILDVNLY